MSEHPVAPVPQQFEPLPPVGGRSRLVLVAVAAVVVLGLVVAGVLIATNDEDPAERAGGSGLPSPTSTATAPADAGCGEVVTKPVEKAALHVNPAERVDYPDAPPAFGDHAPAPAPFGRPYYASDRPTVEQLVHNLEHGYTIAWYDETVFNDDEALTELREIALDYQQDGERFIAAPWSAQDGEPFPDGAHLALTRWSADPADPGDVSTQRGNWLYCGGVDEGAIDDFFDTWPNAESAEPGLY